MAGLTWVVGGGGGKDLTRETLTTTTTTTMMVMMMMMIMSITKLIWHLCKWSYSSTRVCVYFTFPDLLLLWRAGYGCNSNHNPSKTDRSGSTFLANAHWLPKGHSFWKVPRLRPFVLLVTETCTWGTDNLVCLKTKNNLNYKDPVCTAQ
jgi:hypothetical protein